MGRGSTRTRTPMEVTATGQSLTERLYHELRADILAGNHTPGTRLRPAELAGANKVSLNVVREALNRLAGERLVAALPHQGFTVAEVSVRDLADLTEERILIELVVLRESIDSGDLGWETELVAAHHRLTNTAITAADDPHQVTREWMEVHDRFHAATMAGCPNRRLVSLVGMLGESAAIYRYCSQRYDHGHRDVASEHTAIFTAALDRDADLACRLHREHIERTTQIVTAALTTDGAATA